MVGGEPVADGGAIALCLATQVLGTAVAAEELHAAHPEGVLVSADDTQGLFERQLDLEAQAVAGNDVKSGQGEVGADEDAAAAGGMYDQCEACLRRSGRHIESRQR